MTTLLTGYDGFVGRHLRQALACVPLEREGNPVDLRDAAAVAAAIAEIRPDRVVHLAAQAFVPVSFADPRETFDINFTGTYNLLAGLKDAGFRGRMLYVGSGDTYGNVAPQCLPVTELEPQRPRSPYAVSKVAGEALCYQWSQTGDFGVVLARPFNHIGPGQSPRFAVPDFARQIVAIRLGTRAPILSVGDIDVTRDFTDVRDIVRAYAFLLERGANGEAYNVCSGREVSLREVIAELMAAAGVDARVEQDAARLRRVEHRRMVGSYAKLAAATGWRPEIALRQTVSDIVADELKGGSA